jgi:hypothetical protein
VHSINPKDIGEATLMPEPSSTVQGIDVHVHIATGDNLKAMQAGSTETETTSRATAARAYFGSAARMRVTADEVAEQYRQLNLLAVVFDLDSEAQTGRKMSNDDVAAAWGSRGSSSTRRSRSSARTTSASTRSGTRSAA